MSKAGSKDTLLEDVEELASKILSIGTSSPLIIPRPPLNLERRAFGLARKALLSAGSLGSIQSALESNLSSHRTDDVAPAFYRFQQKELQQDNNISPYHASPFTLTMTKVRQSNPTQTTIHRPVSYKQSAKSNSSNNRMQTRSRQPP